MSVQYPVPGGLSIVFVNDNGTIQYPLAGAFLNETNGISNAAPGLGTQNLPLIGVGRKEPNATDLLISGVVFAGLVVHQNPTLDRRSLFTMGLKK